MPRSRRKFDVDEELAFQMPFGPSARDPSARCVPTPDTQELYDAMRRIEDDFNFGDHLALMDGAESHDGRHGDSLRIPSPSLVPTSPSCASTTASISRGFDDFDLDDHDHRSQERRAVRHGPLGALERAQAALMRKIGACPECKIRKVKCTHFDRTLFEKQYQVYVQSARAGRANAQIAEAIEAAAAARVAASVSGSATSPGGASPGAAYATGGSPVPVAPSTPQQPSFNNGTATEIGSWQTSGLSHQNVSSMQHDEAHAEIQAIEDDVRNASAAAANMSTTAPFYHTSHANHTGPSATQNIFLGPTSLPAYQVPRPNSVSSNLAGEVNPLPICRRVGGVGGIMWECRSGDDALGTSEDPNMVCNLRFRTFQDLCTHFQCEHSSFEDPFIFWKCARMREFEDGVTRICGFLSADPSISCVLCEANHWEQWWYATLCRTPSLTSGPSVRVGSQDSSMAGLNWPGTGYGATQFSSSQGQVDLQLLFPGRYLGANQGGSCYSTSLKVKTKDSCFRGVTVYPQGCPYSKKCRSLKSTTEYISKTQLLAVFLVLFLIALEQWVVAGVSLIGSQTIAPTVVEKARVQLRFMSIIFVIFGVFGMWLFKYAKFSTFGTFVQPTVSAAPVTTWTNLRRLHHPGCVSLNTSDLTRDIEDDGSMVGEDERSEIHEEKVGELTALVN